MCLLPKRIIAIVHYGGEGAEPIGHVGEDKRWTPFSVSVIQCRDGKRAIGQEYMRFSHNKSSQLAMATSTVAQEGERCLQA